MNELKSLIWLEWKKSPYMVGGILTVLAVMFMVLLFGGTTKYIYELFSMLFVSSFAYVVGIIFLVVFSHRLGRDFRSDEFMFLLMSPVKPWKHILGRFLFCAGILGMYFFAISLIAISFIFKYWTGSLGSYIGAVLVVFTEHLTMVIIPLISFTLFVSMAVASYKKRSQWMIQLVLGIGLGIFITNGISKLVDTNGVIVPEVSLNLSKSIAFDPNILEKMMSDDTIHFNNDDDKDAMNLRVDGQKLEFGGDMRVLIEPQLIMILFSVFFLWMAVRVWNEVEL